MLLVPHAGCLAGLADGLRASIEPLVAGSALPTLLLSACADESTDVRQSAFALLGDLAKSCPRWDLGYGLVWQPAWMQSANLQQLPVVGYAVVATARMNAPPNSKQLQLTDMQQSRRATFECHASSTLPDDDQPS
jgi:hypothetical protein